MPNNPEDLDRDLVLDCLCSEGAEDLIFLLREELRFLRAFRRQTKGVQAAFLAHRRIRTEFFSLSPEEAGDRRDPIFAATGLRA